MSQRGVTRDEPDTARSDEGKVAVSLSVNRSLKIFRGIDINPIRTLPINRSVIA
ncbi:hypothetical protein D3C77_733930 [compost metagenome]